MHNSVLMNKINLKTRKSEIWAVAGGKGGTGKTFLTSLMGITLSERNKNVLLVDADFEGANLHNFLNIKKNSNNLTYFFEKNTPLEEIISHTSLPNLKLVIGNISSINAQSVQYQQKLKLFRHISNMKLNTDYILIDLGAGSSLNIIDTFLLADRKIIVLTPEITAIENLYQFIKRLLFRKITQSLAKQGYKRMVKETWQKRDKNSIKTINDFLSFLKITSTEVREILEEEFEKMTLHLLVNQIRNSKEAEMGISIKSVIYKYFGISSKYSGYIEFFDLFWKYINTPGQFYKITQTPLGEAMNLIVSNIMNGEQVKFSNVIYG